MQICKFSARPSDSKKLCDHVWLHLATQLRPDRFKFFSCKKCAKSTIFLQKMIAHCRAEHLIEEPLNCSEFFDLRWKFREEFSSAFFQFFPSEDLIANHLAGSTLGEIWPTIFHRQRLVLWYRCSAPGCYGIAYSPASMLRHVKAVHRGDQNPPPRPGGNPRANAKSVTDPNSNSRSSAEKNCNTKSGADPNSRFGCDSNSKSGGDGRNGAKTEIEFEVIPLWMKEIW